MLFIIKRIKIIQKKNYNIGGKNIADYKRFSEKRFRVFLFFKSSAFSKISAKGKTDRNKHHSKHRKRFCAVVFTAFKFKKEHVSENRNKHYDNKNHRSGKRAPCFFCVRRVGIDFIAIFKPDKENSGDERNYV